MRPWCEIVLLTALTAVAPVQPVQTERPTLTDVYVAGQDASHTYRIPSIIATGKGTLLAFAEARRTGAADDGDIDLVLRRSTDGGVTWSAIQVIGQDDTNTFGNPCAVVDARTGSILVLANGSRGTDTESEIIGGTSEAGRTIWTLRSDDDGVTWSSPVEITSSVKRPDWTWYATGPGVGIQTSTGRIVIPANHAEAGTRVHRSHIIFSDDGGKTWTIGASAAPGTNESQIVELADGRLMLNMRNHPPKPENYRMVATSEDGGRTLSESRPDRVLVEPPAQASLLRLTTAKQHDRNRLLFSNPASTKRERLTVRISYDEGATWPVAKVVHEGPAAYSSLVVLPDFSVGVLFERGTATPYERITFARFSIGWLTGGVDRGRAASTVRAERTRSGTRESPEGESLLSLSM